MGIPCIGYNDVNTQYNLFPNLSVDRGDIVAARKLANELQTNKDFYKQSVKIGKFNYDQLYKEDKFLEKWKTIESRLYSQVETI